MQARTTVSTSRDRSDLSAIHTRLLAWYGQHGRELPWRATRDPYKVLVSEVMLQQTQVDRVIPKYHAFLAQFPTLDALANAPTADVIRAWAGLGYNRRAVNLQRTAQAVVHEHGGVFPRDVDALLALPGIGPYTAGAVACFAFEQDVAFMDTNIRRVVQRVFVGPEEREVATERELLRLAGEAVPGGQGWQWNQAIMELGALICTATSPACWRCPLQHDCRAYQERCRRDTSVFEEGQAAAPRRAARAVAERREVPFTQSNRYFRGRIIDVLRALQPGETLPLDVLGPLVKPGYTLDDVDWLQQLVTGLGADGLLIYDGERARLP